jgi:molybdopterin synthase catalytic subunit
VSDAARGRCGAATRVVLAELRDAPLSVDECLAAVRRDETGAVALFVGAVRDVDAGRRVRGLDYEAHPSAVGELARVAGSVADASPDVVALAVVHRLGALSVGDLAIVVAVSAPHREEAFTACRLLLDRVKAEVPVWKRQHLADGATEWVGLSAADLPEGS